MRGVSGCLWSVDMVKTSRDLCLQSQVFVLNVLQN